MKKISCVLFVLAGLCAGLFAESIVEEIDIKDVADFLESYEFSYENSYTLQIKNNFKPKDVTFDEINALSEFMSLNDGNKIEGPIEYIYFNGIQSAGSFYEIRQKINDAKGKYVCLDLSASDYFSDYYNVYPLPKNAFSGHANLYWLNLGYFGNAEVPANMCKDCKNLQFVIMWSYGKVDDTAFSGVNKNAKLYDDDGNESLLALIHQVKTSEFDNWDYLAFTEEDYNKYLAGNTFEENDDLENQSGDMEDMLNMLYDAAMEQLSFSDLFGDEIQQISAANAEQILSDEIFDETDFYSVAVEFLCNYLLRGEKSGLEQSLNDRYISIFDLNDLVFHTSEAGKEENEESALVAVGIEGNGGTVRDVCFITLEKGEEETWSVSEFSSFCLMAVMLSSMMEQ